MVNNLAIVTANATIPDQLLPYVQAISGLESEMAGDCVFHHAAGHAILVGYPINNPQNSVLVEDSVRILLQKPLLKRITVLSAMPLQQAPETSRVTKDFYWKLDLPAKQPGGKLANLLRRAAREVEVRATPWSKEHAKLAQNFCNTRQLDAGTKYLFENLDSYLEKAKNAELFSALSKSGELKGFAIGDYSALGFAFYMFACRKHDSPPGTSDLLLANLIERATSLGHSAINLGLGINPGVGFFKKKWGAREFLPYIETSWEIRPKTSWWKRLFRTSP